MLEHSVYLKAFMKKPVALKLKFERALFASDYFDVSSTTQNAKTDIICENPNISFSNWLDIIVDTFINEFSMSSVNKAALVNEINIDEFFKESLKEEYNYLKETYSMI